MTKHERITDWIYEDPENPDNKGAVYRLCADCGKTVERINSNDQSPSYTAENVKEHRSPPPLLIGTVSFSIIIAASVILTLILRKRTPKSK